MKQKSAEPECMNQKSAEIAAEARKMALFVVSFFSLLWLPFFFSNDASKVA